MASFHPRNRHQGRYDFARLLACSPALERWMVTTPRGEPSVDFANPEAVKALNRQGLTILLVEQNARAALKLAHRGYVLETGRVTLADDASKLLVDPRVRDAYLGDG